MSADEPTPDAPELKGPDLARATLAAARAAARARGAGPRRVRPRPVTRSGSGPDDRDPVAFGAAVRRLVTERGWESTTSAASVLADWAQVVGPEIADHCAPTSLVDGELVLVAESSAWATQLRLLGPTLLGRVAQHAGAGVATRLTVRAPTQPDWRRGPLRVQGRGPRDTYG